MGDLISLGKNDMLNKQSRIITHIVIKTIIVISLLELAIMLLLTYYKIDMQGVKGALIDAGLLSLFSSPLIYLWVIKPFVIERDFAEQEVRHLALHDPLTNLPNRRLLLEHLDYIIKSCKRNSVYGAILLIDLDGFKPVNDTYGHAAGDMILIRVSSELKKQLRKTDLAARLGGDEFVVLLNNVGDSFKTAEKNAQKVAEKIRSSIKEPINFKDNDLEVDSSIGLRVIEPSDDDIEKIIRDSDSAMYSAKKSGRAQVSLFKIVIKYT